MSQKIHILPEHLMKRIAAGEVVERPASVAKELMENSIDAGAKSISLLIKGAGASLIQVVDDGEGMNEDDVLICCERHATSKIFSAEDLESIQTLGFRGEALASISSVSRMIITSRTKDDEEGTQVFIEDGSIQEVLKVAAKQGTSITVNDLFSNVPARRKFLKSNATELRHIVSVFRRMAISHAEVDFSLFVNDEKTMDLRGGSRENRIKDVWDEEKFLQLVPVEKHTSGITVEGFVSRPGEGRGSREDQFFFLNNRYIVSRSLIHSVLSAYGFRLGKDEYPLYILFIMMAPERFDANVHPTKIEVRFSDEKFVHDLVHSAVQEALRSSSVVPKLHLVPGRKKTESFFRPKQKDAHELGQMTLEIQRPVTGRDKIEYSSAETVSPSLWQLHNRYILSQIKSGLTIIDQHVAHERILYERVMRSKNKNDGVSQQLLFPQTVKLSHEDFLVLTEILPYLERIGFDLKDFGKNTVVIEAVPVEIKTGIERELIFEIIDEYKEVQKESDDIWDAVAKSYACKSAVKSGERLSLQEMASLIDQLFATDEPYFCPHGRPIVVNLTLDEIDKRFGR